MAPTRAEIALTLLESLGGPDGDFGHSLQTATRAERAGADRELVVAALLHDVGKAVTTRDHGRVAAEMLAGLVRPEVAWVIEVHQDFTATEYRNGRGRHARYRHLLHPSYGLAKTFVDEWDLPSRDPEYRTLPLEHFIPLVHEILGHPAPRVRADGWTGLYRGALRCLPTPVAERLDLVTAGPRRMVRTRLRR